MQQRVTARAALALALLLSFGAVGVSVARAQTTQAPFRPGFPATLPAAGPVEFSKPGVADFDGDGVKEIVVGTRGGKLYILNANGTMRAGWPKSLPCQIGSSPAIGDIDGDGFPDIAVGCGTADDVAAPGGVWAFRRDGSLIWRIDPYDYDGNGLPDHVASTPAIGDVDGDGRNEVVFGSFNFLVYVIRRDGTSLPGWPVDVRDTIWSSPALFDLDGDGKLEIIVGSTTHLEPTPNDTPNGGALHVFRADGANFPGFPRYVTPLGIDSSPAVGDIDGDGRPEIVVGGGPSATPITGGHQVYAYRCDGSTPPGWPVTVTGQTNNSPVLVNLDADPALEVVVADDASYLYAFKGNGTQIFKMRPKTGNGVSAVALSEPIVAQVLGSATPDIVVANVGFELVVVSSTGTQLSDDGTHGGKLTFGTTRPIMGAVATDLEGDGILDLIGASGTYDGVDGKVWIWNPGAVGAMPWPAFRQNATDRRGVVSGTAICAPPVPRPLRLYTVTPCRVVDTRQPGGAYTGPALTAGEVRTWTIAGQCGIPASARSVVFNVTVDYASSPGDIRLFPGRESLPWASTINFSAGQTRANNATIPLSSNDSGHMSAKNDQGAGTVHLILDVYGYYD